MGSPAADDDMNRRPSEVTAATDLVGLATPGSGSAMPKVDEADLDKKMGGGVTDLKKESLKEPAAASSSGEASKPTDEPAKPEDTPAQPQGEVAPSAAAPKNAEAAGDSSANEGDPDAPEAEKTSFPILLHEIVSDPATDECIHWLSCGTRFMINDKKKFARDVLPRFYGHAKFTSFTRRLKRWSFTRVPSGPFMGAYYNPNFRRGEPDLAARVRYDHPTPLSGAAMALNKAKVQAMGGLGALQGLHPLLAAGAAGMPLSEQERQVLLAQMGLGPLGGAPGMAGLAGLPGAAAGLQAQAGGGNAQLEALYRAMGQNPAAAQAPQAQGLAATNDNVALQMAMAQQMMQQRQAAAMGLSPLDQARLLAQQQQQQQQGGAPAPGQTPPGQQGQGQNPADQGNQQQLLAAMFLDRLNKQQGGPGSSNSLQNLQNPTQGHQPNVPGANATFANSMPSLISASPATMGASPNNSGASLNQYNLALSRANGGNSMTTLTGGNNPGGQAQQMNMPGANASMSAPNLLNAAGGLAPNQNALLMDFLNRQQQQQQQQQGGPGGGDGKNDPTKTEASC